MNDRQTQNDPSAAQDSAADESRNIPATDPDLQDVYQEFLLLADTPDAATLEKMVAKYPRFAAQLTDFAVEWAMQDLLPGGDSDSQAEEYSAHSGMDMSSAVAAAMDRLHAGLDATPTTHRDPFKDRTPSDLSRLGSRLGLDKTLVAKLRDRRIEAQTVPDFLHRQLADELEVPLDAVIAHLQGPPVLSMGASFKAEGKPEAMGKEPFAQAVERSRLNADEKQALLDGASDRASEDTCGRDSDRG